MHLLWKTEELHCLSCWFFWVILIPGTRGEEIGGVLFCLYFVDTTAAVSSCLMRERDPNNAGLLPIM